MISTNLIDVLDVSRKIHGREDGSMYLLGWAWATLSEDHKKQIAESFNKDLERKENN